LVHITPNRLTTHEHRHKIFFADIPSGHILSQLMEPAYWAHVVNKVNIGDEIIALAEDNLYRAHLLVLGKGVGWVQTYCLQFDELTKPFEMPADADTSYIVEFSGNMHKWRVRRRSDNLVLVSQLKTRDEAVQFLRQYQITLARDGRKTVESAA
jgi:hypothetical protein